MHKRTILGFIALTLIALPFALQSGLKTKAYEVNEVLIPILSVTKYPEKKSINIGETIRVTVIIKNIGNATAYNVTLLDTHPENWSVLIEGQLEMKWLQLPPGAEVIHTYNISIETASTYLIHLGRAKVIYYDNYSTEYIVYSEDPSIYVKIKSGINVNWDEIWRNVTLMESLLVLIIIIPLIIIEYKL